MAFRACILLLTFAALALGVVYIRSEQTRALAKAVAMENDWVAMRRELWRLQTMVARLRAPSRLYGSLDLFGANLAMREVQTATTAKSRRGLCCLSHLLCRSSRKAAAAAFARAARKNCRATAAGRRAFPNQNR